MKKNVKGYVSLISGLISVLFIILAYTVRTTKIVGTDNTFYGFKNVGFACLAIPFAIVALIFGILAMKGRRDTKGAPQGKFDSCYRYGRCFGLQRCCYKHAVRCRQLRKQGHKIGDL